MVIQTKDQIIINDLQSKVKLLNKNKYQLINEIKNRNIEFRKTIKELRLENKELNKQSKFYEYAYYCSLCLHLLFAIYCFI
jgi:hypothetical protein